MRNCITDGHDQCSKPSNTAGQTRIMSRWCHWYFGCQREVRLLFRLGHDPQRFYAVHSTPAHRTNRQNWIDHTTYTPGIVQLAAKVLETWTSAGQGNGTQVWSTGDHGVLAGLVQNHAPRSL